MHDYAICKQQESEYHLGDGGPLYYMFPRLENFPKFLVEQKTRWFKLDLRAGRKYGCIDRA